VAVVAGATLGTATAFASSGHQSSHLGRPALAVHQAKSVSHTHHAVVKAHGPAATHRHGPGQAAKNGNDPVPVVDPTPGDDSDVPGDDDSVTDPSGQGDHHGNCDHQDGSYGQGDDDQGDDDQGDDDQGEDSGNHDGNWGPGGGNDQGGSGGGGSWDGPQHWRAVCVQPTS
jgi:hypothetical protein